MKTLINENLTPGTYDVKFDASVLNGGLYFYKLSVDGTHEETKRMILIK